MKASSSPLHSPLACAPLPEVRIGLVGVGHRGLGTLRRYAFVEGARFVALADYDADRLQQAQAVLTDSGRDAAALLEGEDAWRRLCARRDVDVVYICTDWASHAPIAMAAMEQGKHVAVEVPAALTVEECRALVETSERTRRHCFMAENCCYDPFALAQVAMAEAGVLGAVTHCEGAYFHDLRATFAESARCEGGRPSWMEQHWDAHRGNPYPTHGLGPMAWVLGLHRGDRMVSLTSVSSSVAGTTGGKTNSTLIRTALGRTILLQINLTTPQPYSRLQTVMGSGGYASKYPVPVVQTADMAQALTGEAAEAYVARFLTSPAAQAVVEGRAKGVENAMNYAMDARFVYCLRHGLPLDIDVYDAAEWSCLTELTARSAAEGGRVVEIPDFTGGRWAEGTGHRFYF